MAGDLRSRLFASKRIDSVASRQYGLITCAQLDQAGVTAEVRRGMIEREAITRVRPGVYRLCGSSPSWRSSALAVVLSAGRGSVLSHRSAGVLWGLTERHHEIGTIEITYQGYCRLDGVTSHRHGLARAEIAERFGIPVTTLERTIIDLAMGADAAEVGRYMDDALRRRLTTPARLAVQVMTVPRRGRRGWAPYLEALEDRGVGYDPGANDWEQRMDRLWYQLGLPPAERQYRVRISGRTFKLDRAIVKEKIAVEWNGHSPHGERAQFDYDSDRRALLISAGWLPLDFTSRSSPALIRTTVLSAYEQRRAS